MKLRSPNQPDYQQLTASVNSRRAIWRLVKHASEDSRATGGRGIHDGGHPNMVQGQWELHPVIRVVPQ